MSQPTTVSHSDASNAFDVLGLRNIRIREMRTDTGFKMFYQDLMHRLLIQYSSDGGFKCTPEFLIPPVELSACARFFDVSITYKRIPDHDKEKEQILSLRIKELNQEFSEHTQDGNYLPDGGYLQQYLKRLKSITTQLGVFWYQMNMEIIV